MKLNFYLLGSTLVAALAGFLFGFDTVVISGTTEMLEKRFALGDIALGFTVSSALFGTIIGSLIAGKPSEWYGRKPILMCLAVLYFVSALGCGLAWDWASLLIFRLIGGLAIGGASVVAPLYIAEISPPHARGRLVAMSQFNIVVGLLVAYISNFLIDRYTGSDPECWRWMLGIVAVPSVLFFLFLLPIPESPRWLVEKHRRDEALTVLQKLGNADAAGVLQEIVESLHEKTVAISESFFQRKYLLPILLAFMVASFNQLSGINTVNYYGPKILKAVGAGQTSALAGSVIIGVTNLVFTILGMTLIDRFGRRRLLLVGTCGMVICQGVAAFAFHMNNQMLVLASLMGFMAFFASSSGVVIWVFISEIFPNRVRARGQALGSLTHWAWCTLIQFGYPVVTARVSSSAPFIFFSAMMLLQLVLVLRYMPETKGVSLEEMQRHLGIE